MRRSSLLSFLFPALGLGGCGEAADPCAALASTCFAQQKACVADAGEARCEACPSGQYAAKTGTCEPLPGAPLSHDFDAFTAQPGEEIAGLCQSWNLNNPEEIWVNAVELTQDQASHHSNWMYVPNDLYPGPDGVWPCADRNYHQLDAALAGGVLYAQSTQAAHEVQKFPDGAAVRIPPYSKVIGDVHILNTGSDPVTGHAALSIYSLPLEDVTVKLVPFHLDYQGLHIPPLATSRFTGECEVGKEFAGEIFAQSVYYILPHTHSLASRFFVEALGGTRDGEVLLELAGYDTEAHGRAYDPPVSMEGATGYRFGCEYESNRTEYVDYGIGDQEMCELLGFADSALGFEATIHEAIADGMDENVQLFTAPCDIFAFTWTHDKPGGPGPL